MGSFLQSVGGPLGPRPSPRPGLGGVRMGDWNPPRPVGDWTRRRGTLRQRIAIAKGASYSSYSPRTFASSMSTRLVALVTPMSALNALNFLLQSSGSLSQPLPASPSSSVSKPPKNVPAKNRYKSPRKPRLTCSDLLDKGCQTALCVSSTRKVFFGGNAVVGRSLATLDENCSCKKRVAVTFALVLLRAIAATTLKTHITCALIS